MRTPSLSLAAAALLLAACGSSSSSPTDGPVNDGHLTDEPQSAIDRRCRRPARRHAPLLPRSPMRTQLATPSEPASASPPSTTPRCATSCWRPARTLPQLAALTARWQELGCGGEQCGFRGRPSCGGSGACVFVDPGAACDACPQTLDPVCTTDGQNAANACRARECYDEEPASAGFCPSGPVCTAAGGSCHVRTQGYCCPDGSRFLPGNLTTDCAYSNFDDGCCIADWTPPCTYLGAVSMTLSLNPITCAAEALPVCLMAPESATCTLAGRIILSTGGMSEQRLDTATSVVVAAGAALSVSGTAAGGRTFSCSGVATADPLAPSSWSCQSCVGADCTTCVVQQTHACQLP